MRSEILSIKKNKIVEIFLSGSDYVLNKKIDITNSVTSINPFILSIDDPLSPSESSSLSIELSGDARVDRAKLSDIIEKGLIDTIEVYLFYEGLKKTVFRGTISSIERRREYIKERMLVRFTGGLKSYVKDVGNTPLPMPPYSHPNRDILPRISSILGFDNKRTLIDNPDIITDETTWSLIGYPRIGSKIYFNPSAIALDTKRNTLYTACGSTIFSFSEKDGFREIARFKKTSAFYNGSICHLEYDEKDDLIKGVISTITQRPTYILTGLKGEFSLCPSSSLIEIDASKPFYHFDDDIYIRSSLARWSAKDIDGEITAEAIGWIAPDIYGDDAKKFFDGTIVTALMPEGDYSFNKGSYKLRVKKHSFLKKGMRVCCYLIDDMKDFSDLGFIKNILYEDSYDTITFDYPTKYMYNGTERRGIISELKSPNSSNNIFIPKKMNVDFAYLTSPYPQTPVYVFRRQGYTGMEDALISTMIGELPMTLDVGFYAFRSQTSYDSELKHNARTSPFYLLLRNKRNKYYNLIGGLKLVSERQPKGPNGELLGGDSPVSILNHDKYGDLLKTDGGIYPLHMSDGSIVAGINDTERSDNTGMSSVKRRARILSINPTRINLLNRNIFRTLFVDESGELEWTGNPTLNDNTLLIPARRVRKRFIRTDLVIIGVEPVENAEDVPSNYCGHNRASARIYIRADQTDTLKEGSIVRLIGITGEPGDREYIIQNIEVAFLEDKYFCSLKCKSSEFVTKAYIVGAKTQYPWDYLRDYQERTKDPFSHPPEIDFNELWDAYMNEEKFRKKYIEGLEDEFCSKTIAIFAGYQKNEPFILSLNLKTHEVEEITTPDTEVENEEYTVSDVQGAFLPGIELRNEPVIDSIKLEINSKVIDIIDGGEHYKMPLISELSDTGIYIRLLSDEDVVPIILLPNHLIDANVFVSYRYRQKDTYIKHICISNENLYAFEGGSGRYFVFNNDFVLIKEDKLWNEENGISNLNTGKDIYVITTPHCQILKSSREPPLIVREIKKEEVVVDILYKTLLSFNLIAYASPSGFLHIKRRGGTIGYFELKKEDIIDIDRICEPPVNKVILNYDGGSVEKGNGRPIVNIPAEYISGKGVAEKIAEIYLNVLNNRENIAIKLPIYINISPLDLIKIPEDIIRTRIFNGNSNFEHKTLFFLASSIEYNIYERTQTVNLNGLKYSHFVKNM